MKDKENSMKFINELKRKTRKRYNSEEKIAVVLAGFKQEESIAQICTIGIFDWLFGKKKSNEQLAKK